MSELRQLDVRSAILKAADWIEKNPSKYSFQSTRIPECGSPGCMIGFIGMFAGCKGNVFDVSPALLGKTHNKFVTEIFAIRSENGGGQVTTDASVAAACLRLYADRFHPAQPSKLSGSEVCREIMSRPLNEKETANAA